jgi:membrane protein required for colicin V production
MTEFLENVLHQVPVFVDRLAAVLAGLGTLDVVLILIALILTIRAGIRGFVSEAFGVASVVAGIAVAAVLVVPASAYVDAAADSDSFWNKVIAFLGLFLATYAVLKLVEYILHRLFRSLHLQQLDHVFGLALGVAEGAVIGAVAIAGMHAQPWFDVAAVLEGSVAAQVAEQTLGIGPPTVGSAADVR